LRKRPAADRLSSVGGVTAWPAIEKVGRFTHTPHTPLNVSLEFATKTTAETRSFHPNDETTFALPDPPRRHHTGPTTLEWRSELSFIDANLQQWTSSGLHGRS
jgi:hypothetical protein